MSVQSFLIFVVWTCCVNICYSQAGNMDNIHPEKRSYSGAAHSQVSAESSLTEMFKSLSTAKTSAEKINQYYWISRFHADRLAIDSSLFYSEKIRSEAQADSRETTMAKHFLSKSFALFYRNEVDSELIMNVISVFRKSGDHLFTGLAYRHLGRQHTMRGNIEASRESYHAALEFLKKSGEKKEIQVVCLELGRSYYNSYETDSAAFYLIEALSRAESLRDKQGIFNSAGVLGDVYLAINDIPNAVKYLRYALDVRTPGTFTILARNRLASYAICMLKLGDFSTADRLIKEYEEISGRYGDNWGVIVSNKIKGVYQFHKKNYAEAIKYLKLAYSRMTQIKVFSLEVISITNYLAMTEYEMGQYESAIKHLAEVRELARSLRFGGWLMDATLLTSSAHHKNGNKDDAYQYLQLYDRIKDSLFNFQKEKAIIEVTTRYESDKKEQQILLLEREKELNAYQLRSKNDEIEKQQLLDLKKSQQLELLSQQNEISRLVASEKTLAFSNQQKEILKNQNDLKLLVKENELQAAVAKAQTQKKNFAYLAIAAILLFSAFVVYRYSKTKKLSRQLAASLVDLKLAQDQLVKTEKEKESENIRVRISRDIHDEVGATLSGVALFSEIARQKMNQHEPKDAEIYLDHITANSKDMVEKMSDIVWTINPQNDSFDHLINKLQAYAVSLCAGKNIKLHLEIDDRVRGYYPSMQVKRNVYLLLKEGINNAVKYAECRNIHLKLQARNNQMLVELKDDGKGFNLGQELKGNGLNNIRARARELEAKFSIDSASNAGTRICLEFFFHPAGLTRTPA